MTKFKFDYQTHTLAYQIEAGNPWYQIGEQEHFAGNFGSSGFQLTDGWITFTIYANKIRVFFKQMELTDPFRPLEIAYFRKDLPKTLPVIFAFTQPTK